MATAAFKSLIGATRKATLLDNLQTASTEVRDMLSASLNSTLKSQLSSAVTQAGLPVISGLIERMTSADIVAVRTLSIQDFAKKQLDSMVAKDPAMQKAVDGELAKLSATTTIGALLQLDSPLQDHPLLKVDLMKADIASLLATSPALGSNVKVQADFISLYAASTGSTQDFWNELGSDVEFKAAVPELQFTFQLGALTLSNAPLVAALRRHYTPKSVRDLTALTEENWTQLISDNKLTIPDSITGTTTAEKTANYVTAILDSLQSAFPTDYVAQSVAAGPQDQIDQHVARFLKDTAQFNLITTNIQQHLAQNTEALDSVPEDQRKAVVSRLSGYQRLTRIHSNPKVVTALMSKGLDSGYKIASIPRTAFLSQYTALLGSGDKAEVVHANAQRVTASALNLFTTIQGGLNSGNPLVLGNVGIQVVSLLQQIPNWEELFGPTSYCTCKDCRSVLGAAAYLADLLHLLSTWKADPTNSGSGSLLSVLNHRRPDLANIKLNCQNTNTLLPYLDLVNEILENVVITAPGQLPIPPAYNTPADATSDELIVNPEYTSDAAYVQLANAFFPFSLPYDRFLSAARSYLEFANSSLHHVMKTFQIGIDPAVPANSNPNPAPSDQTIALEYLKISANELLILTGQTFQGTSPLSNANDLAKYYGMKATLQKIAEIDATGGAVRANNVVTITTKSSHHFTAGALVMISGVNNSSFDGTFVIKSVPSSKSFTYSQSGANATSGNGSAISDWYVDLTLAKTFLKQCGISFDDLVCLLKTQFLNPSQTITLQIDPKNPCDVDGVVIANLCPMDDKKNAVNFTPLHKFYRFIRLYTKLGWSISDLDHALTSLSAIDINTSLLLTLSKVKQIQDGLSLTVAQALGLWRNVGTDGSDSLYISLFENRGSIYPPDPLFSLQYKSSVPAASAAGLSVLSPYSAQVSYSAGQLKFSGTNGQPMTANQERFLLSLSTDAAYRQAVIELFIQKQTSVALASLPAGLALPAQLPDAIYYQGSELFVVGKMADALRTQLKSLSTDLHFQLAIDNLYGQRWTANIELAVATQALATSAGQLIPAQNLASHSGPILAALRIPATDLAAILNYIWSQTASAPTVSASNTGGSLSSGVYFIKIAAVDAFGERLVLNEVIATASGPNGSIALSWTAVPGATSYNVYYTVANGGPGNETLKINSTSTNATISSTSAGGSVVAGTPPVAIALPFNLSNLSAVYRFATLAGALGISAADLVSLIQLIGINAFQASKPGSIEFLKKAKKVLQSNFSVAQLNYIYRNIASPSAGLAPQQADLDQFVSSLQSALAARPAETSPATDPTGTLLANCLHAVLEDSDVTQLMNLISGSSQFSAALAALPPISFPATLSAVISFGGGTLTFSGPMSPAQRAELLALSTDANYQTAIQNLFQQGQAAWGTVYKSTASPAVLPAVTFPPAFGGSVSNAVQFSVGTAPVISSLAPSVGQAGASITITGANFGAAQGTSTVTVNGTAAAITSWSDTQIVVTVPAGATSGDVVIKVAGVTSNTTQFLVGAAPVIGSLTPPVAQAGASITIKGANFGAAQGASTVTLNGAPASVTSWADTQIVVSVPAGAVSGNLAVIVAGVTSNASPFLVGTATVIASLMPPAGQAGASVTIQGANFGAAQNTSTVTFNGRPAVITSWSDTQIVATLPAGAATGNVVVTVAPVISVDAAGLAILFAGPMSADQESVLLGLSNDLNYQAAIQNVFNQSAAAWATNYTASLAALPVINFPSLAGGNIAFSQSAGTLTVTGFISNQDEAVLLGLSADASFQTAVESLYMQPRQFIAARLFFLETSEVISEVLDSPSSSFADRCGLLLNALLKPFDVIIQTVSTAIHLDVSAVQLLLAGGQTSSRGALLRSKIDPNLSAIADFFALLGNGLSASYYPNRNFQGAVVQPSPIEPAVNFNWGPLSVPSPGLNPNAFSAKWTGQLLGRFSETYTIYAQLSPEPPIGTVTTAGTGVTWVSGAKFDTSWTGPIHINGMAYNIQSVTNATNLVLTISAGTQNSAVHYCVSPIAIIVGGKPLVFSPANPASSGGTVNSSSVELQATVDLAGGKLTDIEVDYPNAQNLNITGLQLNWSSLSTPKAVIPQHVLYASTTFEFDQPLATYELLSRIALSLNQFSITRDDLTYLSTHSTSFTGVDPNNSAKTAPFDLNALPADASAYSTALFNQWERLSALFTLRDSLPGGDARLLNIFEVALGNPAPSTSTLVAAISGATGWDATELAILIGSQIDPVTSQKFGFGLTAGDFVDERWLVRLQRCFALASLFGVSSKYLFEWTTLGSTSLTEPNLTRDIQAAIKARYDDKTWNIVGKSLNDRLRQSSRDALVAYILANQSTWNLGATLETADDLYEYYLIDVEMGACMQTSRIVQASAAVQLFVQRCLMSLEQSVSPAAVDSTIWSWMKNYRVWQANREVFLYPENWMDPTLRDDRTPFFRDLQNELQQGPVTADSASQALFDYLEKLDQVARLEVCAVYYQSDPNSQTLPDGTPDSTEDVLHVFARTPTTPNLYYYRRLTNASQYGTVDGASAWTAWERVNLDIQGDHLIPVFWNGHLYLFWPIFNETSNSTQPPGISGPTRKEMQIQLAWGHYSQGAWSSKQVSNEYIVPAFLPTFSGQVMTDSSATVTWVSGSLFSAGWVGMTIHIDGVDFTVKSVESSSSLTLSAAVGTTSLTTGLANFNVDINAISPYYTNTLDPRWFTFSYYIGRQGELLISAWIPSTGGPPYITFSPDQPPTLDQWGDPEAYISAVGVFFMSGCGSDVITQDFGTDPPLTRVPRLLTIPTNAVFAYQALQEIRAVKGSNSNDGTLTIPFVSSTGMLKSPVLNATPSTFHLAFGEPEYSSYSFSSLGLYVSDFQPFFYQDAERTYFVTPQAVEQATFTQVTFAAPAFAAAALRELPPDSSLPILKTAERAQSNPAIGGQQPETVSRRSTALVPSATQAIAVKQPPRYQVSGTSQTAELEFAPFWHPQICGFIKALNQYGIPTAFSLLDQRRINDGLVLWGFVLSVPSTSHDLFVNLTAGALYAQGQLYQTPPGTVPIVQAMNDQASQSQFLYCEPSGSFYYTTTQTPKTPGDALIGRVDADGAGTILRVVQGSSFTQTTIFEQTYSPTSLVMQPFPVEDVDFSFDGAYSIYNWELFFHIPLFIATQLSQNQQFEDAQKWFHYIFNPTNNSTEAVPQRFWNFLPFHQCSAADEINSGIQNLLLQLDSPMIASLSPVSGPLGTIFRITGSNFGATPGTIGIGGVAAPIVSWANTEIVAAVPPGAAAGYANIAVTAAGKPSNTVAFTVGPTVSNPQSGDCGLDIATQVSRWMLSPFDPFLIGRARTIAFRKTVVMKYLDNLVAWGDYLFSQNTRESINEATQLYVLAQQILGDKPVSMPQGTTQDYSYNELVNLGLDDFSNALVTLESTFPFSTGNNSVAGSSGTGTTGLNGVAAQSFYFCVPPNDQLLAYWDTVAGRLTKIRNCQNIQGQAQQLPLFAPPINPAVLVRAVASGIDLSSVLNDINTPLPKYRFTFTVQKALELCAEVRALGASLLSALEKNDAEKLSLLRATQENGLLKAVLQMKQSQLDEANDNLAGLQASQAVTTFRQQYYQQLTSVGYSSYEQTQLSELSEAQTFQMLSQVLDIESGIAALVPNVTIGIEGEASSPVSTITFGGVDLQAALAAMSRSMTMLSSFHSYTANLASIMGGWDRRSQEWNFQVQSATKELVQIQKQIDAAGVRVQIAQEDLQNQQLQISNSQAVVDLLNSKYTNQELYGWMTSQLSATYFQCYQMAYGLAKRAEACFRFELGLSSSNYIQFGYWDSLRKGLLAGESLYADLKRMETAYLDQNQREYEITKYISLVLFDPLALVTLKETGTCVVSLPEALFDMDYPGQYMRRIKSVSLTIPCVTGPYTSVNAKLTLVSSQIRIDNNATGIQDYGQDFHFMSNAAATQSIATSSAQNDNGMFELNFRDERYLPFEGAGVISQWLLELPKDCNVFDFETISDVVIALKYTARDGGDGLRAIAKQAAVLQGPANQPVEMSPAVSFPKQDNRVRFFSLRHEFPTEWYRFLNPPPADTAQTMLLALNKERFPFQYRGKKISVFGVDLILQFKDISNTTQFKSGTPLGDFVNRQGSSGMKVYITQANVPPGQQPQPPSQPSANSNAISLVSVPTNFNGAPNGSASGLALNPGTWWLQLFTTDAFGLSPSLIDPNHHLNPQPIEDLFLVCHYSVR
jgi:hypothetical protein